MRKKGFTLIELLAVIVVLAVIALIAVPIVLNIIEQAREGATEASARNYIKAVETYVVSSELDKKDILLKNNKYYITKTTTVEDKTYQAINDLVELKGTKPNGNEDYVKLGDNYQIEEAKLIINGYELFLKNDKIVSITKNDNIIKESLLSDVVSVGDYVAYDAGTWTETKDKPTSQGEFGGYTKGVSKSDTILGCWNSDKYKSVLKGWRVLKIENNQVYIVHAGISECYYYACLTNSSDEAIMNLNNRAASEYLNTKYAVSAHMLNYAEAVAITGSTGFTDNDLRYIGPPETSINSALYWLASKYSDSKLFHSSWNQSLIDANAGGALGIRPVVVLKSNIKTTGKTTDVVGQEAWSLIAP